ncbi:MAG: hypothetical protein WA790_02305 [Sulfitobacter sp.]
MKSAFRPWHSYHDLSITASIIAAALFLCLLLVPGLIHWLFAIPSDPATDFMSRRAGVLFLGLSIITFQARHAPQNPLRRGISLGIATLMGGLALLGTFEFFRGQTGIGIWLAIVTEAAFFALYTRFWFAKS